MKTTNTKKCPKCGSTSIDIMKTWNLTSPLPDRMGRITVTIMGVLRCSNCGYSWKGVVTKLKVGGGVEIEGKATIMEEDRKPREIVLDLDEILGEN
ncbi:MAG: chromatin protein Cren7 [Desulfurococcaceae archaeon]